MTPARVFVCALVLLTVTPAGAHRLDEYLQATTIELEKGRVRAEIRLVPGVAVFPSVFADIDSNSDGVASAAEQQSYAERVLALDLSLSIDGMRLPVRLISSAFAPKELLEGGGGEIRLRLEADVPGTGSKRRFTFVNHHRSQIGSYLVNTLVSRDPDIQLAAPQRSDDQSFYQLEYTEVSAPAGMVSFAPGPGPWGWIAAAAMGLAVGLALMRRSLT